MIKDIINPIIKIKSDIETLNQLREFSEDSLDEGLKSEFESLYKENEKNIKEQEIDLGLNYNYTLTAYIIEIEDRVGNTKIYDSTVVLPVTNTVYKITTEDELIYFRKLLYSNHFNNQTIRTFMLCKNLPKTH